MQIFHSEKYNKYFNKDVESVNNFIITSSKTWTDIDESLI